LKAIQVTLFIHLLISAIGCLVSTKRKFIITNPIKNHYNDEDRFFPLDLQSDYLGAYDLKN